MNQYLNQLIHYYNKNISFQLIADTIIIILIYYLAKFAVNKFLHPFVKKLTEKTETVLDDLLLPLLLKYLIKLFQLGAFYFFITNFQPIYKSKAFWRSVDNVFYVLMALIMYMLINKVIKSLIIWYIQHAAIKANTKMDDQFAPLIERIVKLFLFFIFTAIILDHFGQDIKAVMVTLGVGSFAIAFAAKDTLANMISGFVIMLDRPFRIGDRVELGPNVVGDVVDIGMRTTKIKDFENNILIVPNADIASAKVTNYSYPNHQMRVKVFVSVAYGSNIDHVKEILKKAVLADEKCQKNAPVNIFLADLEENALKFRITCYVAEFDDVYEAAERIRIRIYNLLNEEKIIIPFPQRVVTIKRN